jgi:hypothetical protein
MLQPFGNQEPDVPKPQGGSGFSLSNWRDYAGEFVNQISPIRRTESGGFKFGFRPFEQTVLDLFTGGSSAPDIDLKEFFSGGTSPQTRADWMNLPETRALFVDADSRKPEDIYSGAASGLNATEAAEIERYWRDLQQYGGNRAELLRNMFKGMSAAQARAGAATERGGQQLAADIEALYSQLGADVAGLSADAVAGGPTGGLVPVSGAAATAPVEMQATGGNLADFLERSTGAQVQNMYDLAGIQGLQGAAMSQGFLDMLTMAEGQARAEARIRAGQRSAAAAQQQAADLRAFEQRQYEQGRFFDQEKAAEEFMAAGQGLSPQQFAMMSMAAGDERKIQDQIKKFRDRGFSDEQILAYFEQMGSLGQ